MMTTLWVVYDPFGLNDPRTARSSRALAIETFLAIVAVRGGDDRSWEEWESRGYRCQEWALVPADKVSDRAMISDLKSRTANDG